MKAANGPWLVVHVAAHTARSVVLTLAVRNRNRRALELPMAGRPAYDFVVARPDGSQVWRWSRGHVRQDILEMRTLQPGEELVLKAEWDRRDNHGRPVPPGEYVVVGLLRSEPADLIASPTPLHMR